MSTGNAIRDTRISRRRFLQGATMTGTALALGADLLPSSQAVAGSPGPATEGILVLVELAGGNDGLNTVVPVTAARYHDLRRDAGLALASDGLRDVGGGFGLHPSLAYLHTRFTSRNLAIVHGFGHPGNTRSHFETTEVMATCSPAGSVPPTGWIGRALDTMGNAALRGVSIDSSGNLLFTGSRSSATGVPSRANGLFGSDRSNEWDTTAYQQLASISKASRGIGPWGPRIANAVGSALDQAQTLNPVYSAAAPSEDPAVVRFFTAARVINLDVGVRVVHLQLAGFDTHSQQLKNHAWVLSQLDNGLRTFFETLDARFRERVVVATYSEFGRRPRANASGGTDHGGAAVQFVTGDLVIGGHYGEPPSLDRLDQNGDLVVTVDARSLFATLAGSWLGGDDEAIFDGAYPKLDLFRMVPSSIGTPSTSGSLLGYQAVTPFRLVDTRLGEGAPMGKRGATPLVVQVAGHCTVPTAQVGAVMCNITVTNPDTAGFLTAWPAGATRPDASNVNFATGETAPNIAIVKVGDNGSICLAVDGGPADVVLDVLGWTPSDDAFVPIIAHRVVDTRRDLGGSRLGPGEVRTFGLAGDGPVPLGVDAVAINLTAADADGETFLTAWPAGIERPNTSVLNMVDRQPVANLVIQPVSSEGEVELYNAFGSTEVIVDVSGWFPRGSGFRPAKPQRILDTRVGLGAEGAVGHNATIELALPPELAGAARSVVLNVTAAEPSVGGYLTVWPTGVVRPTTSNVNFTTGQVTANLVVCGIGTGCSISIFNAYGTTHVIGDLIGWFD
jgi:uncharacterized protein (DUF1501 family)